MSKLTPSSIKIPILHPSSSRCWEILTGSLFDSQPKPLVVNLMPLIFGWEKDGLFLPCTRTIMKTCMRWSEGPRSLPCFHLPPGPSCLIGTITRLILFPWMRPPLLKQQRSLFLGHSGLEMFPPNQPFRGLHSIQTKMGVIARWRWVDHPWNHSQNCSPIYRQGPY